MVYIRHRDRMVQESVFNDLRDTLIACRWMAGTTSRPMVSPYDRGAGYQVITTAGNQVLKMAKGTAVTLIDYFPEASDPEGITGQPEKGHTPPNRMAMDDGQPGEPVPLELGSTLCEQPYRFAIAFWGTNVAVCQAVMNDLRDRYLGNAVSFPAVPLFDYNTDPDVPVLNMEVDAFSYVRSAEEEVEAYELTLYFAQLTIVDIVDDAGVGVPLLPPDEPDEIPPITFRHVSGGSFSLDPGDVIMNNTGAGVFVPSDDPGFAFVLPDDVVDGETYAVYSSLLGVLARVTANDESVAPLTSIPIGSYYFQQVMSWPIDVAALEAAIAAYSSYGLTMESLGLAFQFYQDDTGTYALDTPPPEAPAFRHVAVGDPIDSDPGDPGLDVVGQVLVPDGAGVVTFVLIDGLEDGHEYTLGGV